MKFLTKDERAEAINLAMDIDTGLISIEDTLDFFAKPENLELGQGILRFWYSASTMTNLLFYRFFYETLYKKESYTDSLHDDGD